MKLKKITAALLSAALLLTQTVPVSAQDAPESDAAALPYGLKGMPAGYAPDADAAALKAKTRNAFGILSSLTPGVDYVSDQILFFADSRAEAETISAAYNADLFLFQYGIATATLRSGITVEQAVKIGSDARFALPAVTPNFITKLDEPIPEAGGGLEVPEAPESDASAAKNGQQGWADALSDPALQVDYKFESKDAASPESQGTITDGYQWMHDAVGTYEAWNTTMGSPEITVAVIDTGIDDLHEDLIGHSENLTGIVDLSYQDVVRDEYGNIVYDENGDPLYETITPDALDGVGHGTHVAGIIGATADNEVGGAGIAPGVSIIGLPVFIDIQGGNYCLDNAVMSAIMYVAGYNEDGSKGKARANIINMSLGGPGYNPAYQAVIDEAYESNVTICAAMGNACSNIITYPACYDHVIAVCATNEDNTKTYFSNYGPWADISAPGIHIFSTWNGHDQDSVTREYYTEDHHDWYASWAGTSMATPVVAGACALYMSAVGVVDPDTMESVLKKNATKLSEKDLGAGLVNIAAMMPDSALSAKLGAPVFYKTVKGEEEEERIAVKSSVTLEEGEKLIVDVPEGAASSFAVATFDGSEPSYKNDAAGANSFIIPIDEPFSPDEYISEKSYTMKAAYVSTKGTVGTTASLAVKVNTEYEHAIVITGSECAAAGKAVKYTAYINSAPAKVTWGVEGAPAGTVIDSNGTLKVGKGASAGAEFKVTAVSGSAKGELAVSVTAPVTAVIIGFENNAVKDEINVPVKDKNGGYKSIRLYNKDIQSTKDFKENEAAVSITMTGLPTGKTPFVTCVSSKPGVAVYKDGKIVAVGVGKAKLTFTAGDGSGKKAAIDVNVIAPASNIVINRKNNQRYIAFGKSAQAVAMLGTTYGAPTIKTASWDFTAEYKYVNINNTNDTITDDATSDMKSQKFVTVDKNGKVSVNKKLENYLYGMSEKTVNDKTYVVNDVILTVTGTTTDGTGFSASTTFTVTAPAQIVYLMWSDSTAYTVTTGNTFMLSMPVDSNGMAYRYTAFTFCVNAAGMWYSSDPNAYSFVSSNPESGSISCDGINQDNGFVQFTVTIIKPGRTKVTVKANDGSNKKLDLNIYSFGYTVQ